MKLTRRKFFTGLAVAPLAIAIAPQLPPTNDTSLMLKRWWGSKYFVFKKSRQFGTTIATWRKIYSGVGVLNETNDIFTDLKRKPRNED